MRGFVVCLPTCLHASMQGRVALSMCSCRAKRKGAYSSAYGPVHEWANAHAPQAPQQPLPPPPQPPPQQQQQQQQQHSQGRAAPPEADEQPPQTEPHAQAAQQQADAATMKGEQVTGQALGTGECGAGPVEPQLHDANSEPNDTVRRRLVEEDSA